MEDKIKLRSDERIEVLYAVLDSDVPRKFSRTQILDMIDTEFAFQKFYARWSKYRIFMWGFKIFDWSVSGFILDGFR